jgi:adenylate kinase
VNKVVVVTGVPGSGKSTVIDRALRELKERGIDYEVVNYGDVMMELMREREGVTDRDEMRKIPTDRYREIQREAGRRIAEEAKKKSVLVDTHCLIKKPEGYYPGLPIWVLRELEPELIILVEAEEVEIARRRVKDIDRKRDQELLIEISEHQQLNRATAMAYAAITGAAVRLIQNRDQKLNEAVNEMVSALR